MSDFGAKVSARGYDVLTAADQNLIFSSSWPTLMIERIGSVTYTQNSTPQTLYTHNLGYVPMMLQWEEGYGLTTSFFSVGVDDVGIKYDAKLATGITGTLHYVLFRLPITENFTAPIINQSDVKGSVEHDYGIRVAMDGKSTSSTDLRDYTVHSGARSMMVHKVDCGVTDYTPGPGGTANFTSTHNLDYLPLAFGFIKYTGATYYDPNLWYGCAAPTGAQDSNFTFTTSTGTVQTFSSVVSGPTPATIVTLKNTAFGDITRGTLP